MLQLEKKITTIIALRVTIASLLSILIAYGLGWTQPTDLAFFAPCSVCANILMFPFQSRRNNMMTERLIGSGVGYLIAIAYVQSFPDYPSWGLIYSGILSFSCCYIVGCNVQYTHAYVQVLLIMNVVLTFNYILPDMVVKTWQLPICNLIALATIYFVDIIFYHGQIKKILLSYKNTLFNHFLLQLRQNNAASSAISVYEKHETFLKNFKMHISHGEKQRLNFINGQIKRINNSILLIHQQIEKFPVFHNWLTTDFVVIKQQIAKAIECIKGEKNFDFQETEMFISRFKQRTQQISNKTNLMHIYKLVYELTAILSAMKKIQHLENNKIDDEKQNQEPLLFTSLTLYTVKFSLKTTLSVIITVLLLEKLYIPGLLQAVIASILVSLTPNVNELFYRILMYLAGIIFGGAIALVVGELCFRLDSMVLLFVLCIVVIFFIARLGLIYKQYDYAAIQASVTFIIMLSCGGYAHLNFEYGYERFIGLFCGALIVSVINFLLHPKPPSALINEKIILACEGIKEQLHLFSQQHEKNYFPDLNQTVRQEINQAQALQFKQSHFIIGYKKKHNRLLPLLIRTNYLLSELHLNIYTLKTNQKTAAITDSLYDFFSVIILRLQTEQKYTAASLQYRNLQNHHSLLELIKTDFNAMKETIPYTPQSVKCIACLSSIIETAEKLASL